MDQLGEQLQAVNAILDPARRVEQWRVLCRLRPGTPLPWFNLAVDAAAIGRRAEALDAAVHAIALEPRLRDSFPATVGSLLGPAHPPSAATRVGRADWVGRRLGCHRIVRLRHRSADSSLYDAVNDSSQEPVLLRFATDLGHDDAVTQLRRERHAAEVLGGIVAAIPAVRELVDDEESGQVALALEPTSGRVLAERMGREVELAEGLAIGAALAWAVAGLHARGYIHGALRPALVLEDSAADGAVRVKILGVATGADGRSGTMPLSDERLRWVAPEYGLASGLDARTDVYGIGLILYALFAGEAVPLRDRSGAISFGEHISHRTHPKLREVLGRCLSPVPADRYASAEEVAVLLDELCRRALVAATTIGVPRFATVDAVRDLSGLHLGSWMLLDRIGTGGFGEVYRARHAVIEGKLAAIKVLTQDAAFSRAQRAQVLQEAQAASRARHENIIDIYDCGAQGQWTYLVTELLEGETLRRRLQTAPSGLPLLEALEIAQQVARALRAAHANRVIHLDLKPENVFITRRDGGGLHVKLLDFGIACLTSQLPSGTSVALVRGTPGYMAPEQWQQVALDGGADIYALGVVLYEMLAGKLPFDAAGLAEWGNIHAHAVEPAPLLVRGAPRLAALVGRMLAHRRELRPQGMDEVLRELAACVATFEPQRRSSSWRWLAGLLAGVCVGALVQSACRKPSEESWGPASWVSGRHLP